MLILLILLIALAVILAEPIKKQITKTLYKKEYSNLVGKTMREKYESGLIKNDVEFKEVFKNVLSCCKG